MLNSVEFGQMSEPDASQQFDADRLMEDLSIPAPANINNDGSFKVGEEVNEIKNKVGAIVMNLDRLTDDQKKQAVNILVNRFPDNRHDIREQLEKFTKLEPISHDKELFPEVGKDIK